MAQMQAQEFEANARIRRILRLSEAQSKAEGCCGPCHASKGGDAQPNWYIY